MITSGNTEIKNIYYNGKTIKKVFSCGNYVWSGDTPTPPTPTTSKAEVTYYYNYQYTTYDIPCNTSDTLYSSEVVYHAPNKDYITSVVVGDCVRVLDSTFADYSNLKEVSLPSSLKRILIQTFRYTALETITIPDSVTFVDGGIFMGCTSLKSCILSKNIVDDHGNKVIPSSTFYNCSSLTSVTFADDLDTIETSAFYGCSSLTTITLPSTTRVIKTSSFKSTTNLQSLVCLATTPPILESGAFAESGISAIYVPDESVENYKSATNWISFENIIKPISEKP